MKKSKVSVNWRKVVSMAAAVIMVFALIEWHGFISPVGVKGADTIPADYWTDIGNYDTSWYDYDPNATEFEIETAAELAGLAVICNDTSSTNYINETFEGDIIKLTCDKLDLSAHQWTPIGIVSPGSFEGTFDGEFEADEKCVIEGLIINNTVEDTSARHGLFGYVVGGVIKNLSLDNVDITGFHNVGGVAGTLAYNAAVDNCEVSGVIKGSASVGGVVGCNNNSEVRYCINSGNIKASEPMPSGNTSGAGGIAGYNYSGGRINSCINRGNVTLSSASSGGEYAGAGGIVGVNNNSSIAGCRSEDNAVISVSNLAAQNVGAGGIVGTAALNGANVENCYNASNVTGESFTGQYIGVGGVAGIVWSNTTIDGCVNEGKIVAKNQTSGIGAGGVGGVAGCNGQSGQVTSCHNSGEVLADHQINIGNFGVGGVAGCNVQNAVLASSYNTGPVSNEGILNNGGVGGVAGLNAQGSSEISGCHNTGPVSNEGNLYNGGIGGVAGLNTQGSVLSSSYNTGSITGKDNTGGVAGYNYNGSTVAYSYNSGIISGENNTGGVAGNNDNGTTITLSYNNGKVTGTENVGGIAGSSTGAQPVSNCYNTGIIAGNGANYAGGIIGFLDSSSVTNSYYSGADCGIGSDAGNFDDAIPFVRLTGDSEIEIGDNATKPTESEITEQYTNFNDPDKFGGKFSISYGYDFDADVIQIEDSPTPGPSGATYGTRKVWGKIEALADITANIAVLQPKLDLTNGGFSQSEDPEPAAAEDLIVLDISDTRFVTALVLTAERDAIEFRDSNRLTAAITKNTGQAVSVYPITGKVTFSFDNLDVPQEVSITGSDPDAVSVVCDYLPQNYQSAIEITAHYSGDGYFQPMSGTIQITVDKLATTLDLNAEPGELAQGEAAALTADVTVTDENKTETVNSGKVRFTSGDGALDTEVPVVNGVARYENYRPDASVTVSAKYAGDASSYFKDSSTASVNITVNQTDPQLIPTVTTLTAGPAAVDRGGSTTFTAVVAADPAEAGGMPVTGAVRFVFASGETETVTIGDADNGIAVLDGYVVQSTVTVTAYYDGDLNFNPSHSNTVTVTVNQPAMIQPSLDLTAVPAALDYGETATLTAVITDPDSSGNDITGEVAFSSTNGDLNVIETVAASGQAIVIIDYTPQRQSSQQQSQGFSAATPVTITAAYGGNEFFAPASGLETIYVSDSSGGGDPDPTPNPPGPTPVFPPYVPGYSNTFGYGGGPRPVDRNVRLMNLDRELLQVFNTQTLPVKEGYMELLGAYPAEGYIWSMDLDLLTELSGKHPESAFSLNTPDVDFKYYMPFDMTNIITELSAYVRGDKLTLTNAVLELTVAPLNGDKLSKANADYKAIYPDGKVLSGFYDISLAVYTGNKKVNVNPNLFNKRIGFVINTGEISSPVLGYRQISGRFSFVPSRFTVTASEARTRNHGVFAVLKNNMAYLDSSGHWGESFINNAADRALVFGVGGGLYEPDRMITRAEFTQMIVNALQIPDADAKPVKQYADVQLGAWYYDTVMKARAAGILDTLAAGISFEPNTPITREDMALVLASAIRFENPSIAAGASNKSLEGAFSDYGKVDPAKYNDVEFIYRLNVMQGMANGKFEPKANSTRAQAATVLITFLRALDLID